WVLVSSPPPNGCSTRVYQWCSPSAFVSSVALKSRVYVCAFGSRPLSAPSWARSSASPTRGQVLGTVSATCRSVLPVLTPAIGGGALDAAACGGALAMTGGAAAGGALTGAGGTGLATAG